MSADYRCASRHQTRLPYLRRRTVYVDCENGARAIDVTPKSEPAVVVTAPGAAPELEMVAHAIAFAAFGLIRALPALAAPSGAPGGVF